MNKNKFFTAVITIGISVVILLVIVNFTFNNKINQGNFRVSDTILSSVVELEDKSDINNEWKYDVSQNNKLSMLVQTIGDATVKEVYLDNIKVESRNDVHIYIEQDKYDVKYKYEDLKNKKINIYAEQTEQGDYLVEFDIQNEDVISNFVIPSDIKEIRHDGTMLNVTKTPVSSIKFKIKYNLVLVQDDNKTNTCKVEIEVPDEKIAVDGFFVKRLDSTIYAFKVNY